MKRDLLVKAMAHDPRKSRPGSRNRLQAIVPGAMPARSARGGGGAGNLGVKYDLTGQAGRA